MGEDKGGSGGNECANVKRELLDICTDWNNSLLTYMYIQTHNIQRDNSPILYKVRPINKRPNREKTYLLKND
jgi:hypothetical protein